MFRRSIGGRRTAPTKLERHSAFDKVQAHLSRRDDGAMVRVEGVDVRHHVSLLLCRGAIHSATLIPVLQPLDRREGRQRRGVDDNGYCRTAQADSQTSAVDRVEPAAAP